MFLSLLLTPIFVYQTLSVGITFIIFYVHFQLIETEHLIDIHYLSMSLYLTCIPIFTLTNINLFLRHGLLYFFIIIGWPYYFYFSAMQIFFLFKTPIQFKSSIRFQVSPVRSPPGACEKTQVTRCQAMDFAANPISSTSYN